MPVSLETRPELIAFTERLSAQFAAELMSSSEPTLIVDVRGPREREQKHIEGSVSDPPTLSAAFLLAHG